jgi:hypothetical protein
MITLKPGQYLVLVPVVFLQPTIVSGATSALEAAHKAMNDEDCQEAGELEYSHVNGDANTVTVRDSNLRVTSEAWEDFEG